MGTEVFCEVSAGEGEGGGPSNEGESSFSPSPSPSLSLSFSDEARLLPDWSLVVSRMCELRRNFFRSLPFRDNFAGGGVGERPGETKLTFLLERVLLGVAACAGAELRGGVEGLSCYFKKHKKVDKKKNKLNKTTKQTK